MMLKVLIVDDEPLAREGVRLLLQQEENIKVVGECCNGNEAIRAILSLQPDLVFLDIKMPRLSGFQVIEAVGPENMPTVIFLTAYEEHAIEAFNVHALDYLLKPINAERLHASLGRARKVFKDKDLASKAEQLRALLNSENVRTKDRNDRVVVRSGGHVYLIRPNEIYWVEASGDYVVIHVEDREHLVRDTMLNMEQRLNTRGFKRIHRSTIVNVEYVSELVPTESGDYRVILTNGAELKLSRTYRDDLYQSLDP